jgi:hypothetical protein
MRGEKIRRLPLILLLPLVLSLVSIAFAPVTLPLVYVDPAETTANPGDTVTINVNIQDAVDLYSFQASVGFDPNVLEPITAEEGPFIADATTSPSGTFYQANLYDDFVYVTVVTLGRYPGVNGAGTLFNVTFNVLDAGTSDLHLFDTIFLNSTPTEIAIDVADGLFYTGARANLLRRSAWPEHHHFVVSKDEDGNQTLNAKAKNLGPLDLHVMVVFDIVRDDTFFATVSSDEALVIPDTIVELTADFGPLSPSDAGKYYVTARAWYSWSGTYWAAGDKVKTFSFAVVP